MLKAKRGRRRLTPQERTWNRVHDPLADILLKMVHYKTDSGYAKVAYGGYLGELKKACQRILTIIELHNEQIKKEKSDGKST